MLPRGEAAVKGLLIAAVNGQNRVESLQWNLVNGLLFGVGVAVSHQQAVEKLK